MEDDGSHWSRYIEATVGAPPRSLYRRAVALFSEPGAAIDLGCGAGNESLDLLTRGWRVVAVDSSEAAITTLERRAGGLAGLVLQPAQLWTADLSTADLVYAGFSLFFSPPDRYPETWARASAAVAHGGRFAGHFLGVRDSWATLPEVTAHRESDVHDLLQAFELEYFAEIEDDRDAVSGPKHWHFYEVIGRRAASPDIPVPREPGHDRNG